MPRIRLHSQIPVDGTRALLDGNGTQPEAVELVTREFSSEAEAFTVVVNHQHQSAVILREFYHDMCSLSMLFYVVECFSVNLENLATDAVGSAQIGGIEQ